MSLVTRKIRHVHQGVGLEGYFACPDSPASSFPGILIAPAWAGCNDQAMERANILAKAGFAAFAIDLYGEGRVGKTRDECSQLMGTVAVSYTHLTLPTKA